MSEKRISLTEHGKVRYTLKTPWRDGTPQVIFEPLDFTGDQEDTDLPGGESADHSHGPVA